MDKGAQIKAGIVVLGGLVILAIGIFLVSGGSEIFRDEKQYTVHFTNAGNIGSGDAVYLAGRRVGEVAEVRPWAEDVNGETRYKGVAVVISIHENARIQADSEFTITQSITRIVTMNIQYGEGRNVEPGEVMLMGTTRATFEETIDRAAALIDDARAVVATAAGAAERLDRVLADFEERGLPAEVERFVATLNRTGDEVAALAAELRPQIKDALAKATEAAEQYERLAAELRDGVNRVMGEVSAVAEDVRRIVAENRESLKAFAQGLEDAAARLPAALERLEGFVLASERTISEVRPELVGTLEHARRAMENFSSLTEDLRTAPWKLVNKPSDEEVREIHLYNAARLYVAAAARVRESIDELDALRESGALGGEERAGAVDAAIDRLRRSLEEYDERERELVDRMVAPR